MSLSPPPPGQRVATAPTVANTNVELARTKRKIASLQDELDKATGHKKKDADEVNEGRALARIVSLFDSLVSLLEEADRRLTAEQDSDGDAREVDEEVTRERSRKYSSYILLLRAIPKVRDLIEEPNSLEELYSFLAKLQKGVKGARRDDIRRILSELPQWLNEDYSPTRSFALKHRRDRGLQNDITGRLLCPIHLDWNDEKVRADIRSGKVSIGDEYFLSCFYPKGKGDPKNLEKRFLQSQLLVKTFCAIFTSPSSAEAFSEEDEDGPQRKKTKSDAQKQVTKATVAEIIGMEGIVTPRTIAYATVMLAFNLTDCSSWRPCYAGFHYRGLYNFVIDFFEDVNDPATRRKVDQLLSWWNRQIFPERVGVTKESHKSTNWLKQQRAEKAAAEQAPLSS